MSYAWEKGGSSQSSKTQYAWEKPLPVNEPVTLFSRQESEATPIDYNTVQNFSKYNPIVQTYANDKTTDNIGSAFDTPKKIIAPVSKPAKTNIFQSLINGLNAGGYAADKAILSIPQGLASILPRIDAAIKGKQYNPSNDIVLNPLSKASNYIGNQQQQAESKFDNGSAANKWVGKGAEMLPQALEMSLEMAAPVGKLGKLGDVLGGGVEPLTDLSARTGSKILTKLPEGVQPGAKVLGGIAQSGIKTGAEMGAYGALRTGLEGGSPQDMLNSAKENAIGGALFGAGGKALGDIIPAIGNKAIKTTTSENTMPGYDSNGIKLPTIKKPYLAPKKLTIVDTKNPAAQQAYEDAIQEIQNKFMTNKLTPEEIAQIPGMGIDLNSLVNNLDSHTNMNDVRSQADKSMWKVKTGVQDAKNLKNNSLIQPTKGKVALSNDVAPMSNKTSQNVLKRGQTFNLTTGKLEMPEVAPTDNVKSRSYSQTVKNSPLTNPNVAEKMDFDYNPITNKDTVIQAQKIINADPIKAKEWVMSEEPSTATQNATAQLLIKQAQDEGRYGDAVDMVQKVAEKATKQGQAIQALSLWNRLTPEGMLKFAQQTFDKANLKLPENKKIKITNEFAQSITERMKEINNMVEGSAKDEATQTVLKDIADQVPASIWKKIDTLQTMAQLLNPKTSIRNILGNVGMMVNENLSNAIGTPLDWATSKVTGKRTVSLPSLPTQLKGYKEGFTNGVRQTRLGINADGTQFDLPDSKVFESKLLNNGQKVLDYMLKVPDEASKKAIYNDSLRSQMKLAGVTTPTEEMIQTATNDAKYGTFQDDNAVSNAFGAIKKALNLNKEFGLGSMILKYPKTPANILMRAIDYSPAGFFKSVYRLAEPLLKGNEFNQRDFVKSTSRALVGSGNLIGTGYILSKLGIITGKSSDDYDTAAMQKMSGLGDYKLNLSALRRFVASGFNTNNAKAQQGDKLINYDWLQPSSIGLAIGANASESKKNGATDILSTVVDSLSSGMNTLAQQPLISGLTKFAGQKDITKAITETLKGIPASVVPTIFKQIAQLTDNTTRNTYDPSWGNVATNMVKAKLPGISKSLQPKLDTFGNPQKAYESNNPFDVFLNPAFTSTYNTNQAAQLPVNLYNQDGSTIQMPRVTNTYITYKGQKIQLTPQENADLQKYVGQRTEDTFQTLSKDPAFLAMPYDEQEKQMQKYLTKVNKDGTDTILEKRGLK